MLNSWLEGLSVKIPTGKRRDYECEVDSSCICQDGRLSTGQDMTSSALLIRVQFGRIQSRTGKIFSNKNQ